MITEKLNDMNKFLPIMTFYDSWKIIYLPQSTLSFSRIYKSIVTLPEFIYP